MLKVKSPAAPHKQQVAIHLKNQFALMQTLYRH